MFYQILPNAIFILAVLGILLMILRRLPEAAGLQQQDLPVDQKLQDKGLPVQAISKIKPVVILWRKRIWNFMLEAKDLKPAAIPGYRLKKMFGHRFKAPAEKPTAVVPTTTAEVKDEKHYLDLIKKEPKNLANYDALGKFYLESGNYSDAKDIYLYLTKHNATNSDYYARLAVSLYQLEQYDKAANYYQKSLGLDSSQPNRYYNMGLSLEAAGKLEEAVEAFEQAVALEHSNSKFHIALSNIYKKIGETEKAEDILQNMPEEQHSDKKIKVSG